MVDLKRYAYISIVAAVFTIALKMAAYLVTDSVGLLSDACESLVNLIAALIALAALAWAAQPEDKEHAFGHSKAEYFSSAIEGVLIIVAAVCIIWAAVQRIYNPQPLTEMGLGTILSLIASVINFIVALILTKAGRKYDSITLEADAKHLMTDVLTSAAVVIGVLAVWLTGVDSLDPVIALIVVGNIIFAGFGLITRSIYGLMDGAIPRQEIQAIEKIFADYRLKGAEFHALRTRLAGSRRFVSFHILLSGKLSLSEAHDFVEEVEREVRAVASHVHVTTHLEPLEDESAYQDMELERKV